MFFRTNVSLVLILFLALASCSKKAAVQSTFSKPDPAQFDNLRDSVTQIAALAKGHVGVSAMILETGETVVALNPRDHFPMQSVYKLPISMAVMKQVDGGRLKLEQKVAVAKSDFVRAGQHSPIRDRNPNGAEIAVNELIRFAIVESDGTASDVLMKLAGGPQAVQAYLNDLSVNDLIVLNTEKEIGQDWQVQYRNFSTPDAAVALLRALHEKRGLSESSQGLILKYLVESIPGAKRLKGLLPAGTIVAHKTGTSGTEKGITAATNDIGIITLPNGNHLAIAVFVSDSPTDEATREGVIAKIAKLVVDSQRQ
ncbi:MAG TPA: class A beta-lactamase [Pyrinomonadaceae bacterium]|nr:class A beta-lactamase [Pyrinomonadaceae bacterium]